MMHTCQPNAAPYNKSHCMCMSISIDALPSLATEAGLSQQLNHLQLVQPCRWAHTQPQHFCNQCAGTILTCPQMPPEPVATYCHCAQHTRHHRHSKSLTDTWAVLRLSLQTCTLSAMLPSAAFTHTQDQEGTCSTCCMTLHPWALWNKAGRLLSVALLRLFIQIFLSLFSASHTTQAVSCDAAHLACTVLVSLAAIVMHASITPAFNIFP